MDYSTASERIVINTVVLNIRLVVVMVIGLVTTRLVLAALGEDNFGIYSLVAGVVGMLAFLQGAMSIASMRFLAYGLGSSDIENQLKTFNTTLFLHFALGLLLVIVVELGGLIMFRYYLNIPADSIIDAKIIFHFMVLTTFITIISVPYEAVINSHENMTFLTIVDIIGSILRLGAAIVITFANSNAMIVYGALMASIQLIVRIINQLYTSNKYKECKVNFRKNVDNKLIKSILSFSSWNLMGSLSSMLVSQFRSVLLNMFFGVKVNATQGIAQTVSSQVNTVSVSMTQAIRPQLMKSEGSGDRVKMLKITNTAAKFSVFLFALLAIPVIIEISFLLNIWLTIVPDYTVIFCRLIILGLFIDKMTFEIGTAISAVGKIKSITLAESSTIIISVITAYIFFKLGYPPPTLYIVIIMFGIIVSLERFYFGQKVAGLNALNYLKHSIIPVIIPIIITFIVSMVPYLLMSEGFLRFVVTLLITIFSLSLTFRYIGLNKEEYYKIKNIYSYYLNRVKVRLQSKTGE